MLDDDDRIALVYQAVKYAHQYADVFEVEAGSRLVEDVNRFARITLGELGGELHALAFSARQGGGWLAQLDVAQTYLLQHLDFVQDVGHVFEELYGTVDGHVEHIGDGLALEADFQRLAVVSLAVAYLAWHQYIGQEVHFDGLVAVTSAGLASSAGDIEREASGLVSTHFGFGQAYKEVADVREYAGIGSRIGAWRAS